jgi:hypothetical protein
MGRSVYNGGVTLVLGAVGSLLQDVSPLEGRLWMRDGSRRATEKF